MQRKNGSVAPPSGRLSARGSSETNGVEIERASLRFYDGSTRGNALTPLRLRNNVFFERPPITKTILRHGKGRLTWFLSPHPRLDRHVCQCGPSPQLVAARRISLRWCLLIVLLTSGHPAHVQSLRDRGDTTENQTIRRRRQDHSSSQSCCVGSPLFQMSREFPTNRATEEYYNQATPNIKRIIEHCGTH